MPHRLLYALTGLVLGLVVVVSGGGSLTVAAETARDKALEAALDSFRKGDYDTAAKAFRPLAEEGNPEAQYHLGFQATEGLGMPQDDRAAARWFRRAAMAGHGKAQNHLGLMFFEGRGVTRDFGEAFVFFELAAVSGHEDAANNRLIVARKMTSEQISAAQKKAGRLLGVLQSSTQKARSRSLASGVIVTTDGLILTHVDAVNGCGRLRVRHAEKSVEATLVIADRFNNIAVLSIPGPVAPVPMLGDIAVQPRQKVWLAAFQRDEEDRAMLTVAATVIAQSPGLERVDERYLEIVALPNMAELGAPIFDDRGVLIGLLSPGTSADAVARIRGTAPDAAAFVLRVQIARILLDTVGGAYRLASMADYSQEPPTEDLIRATTVAIECIGREDGT